MRNLANSWLILLKFYCSHGATSQKNDSRGLRQFIAITSLTVEWNSSSLYFTSISFNACKWDVARSWSLLISRSSCFAALCSTSANDFSWNKDGSWKNEQENHVRISLILELLLCFLNHVTSSKYAVMSGFNNANQRRQHQCNIAYIRKQCSHLTKLNEPRSWGFIWSTKWSLKVMIVSTA